MNLANYMFGVARSPRLTTDYLTKPEYRLYNGQGRKVEVNIMIS